MYVRNVGGRGWGPSPEYRSVQAQRSDRRDHPGRSPPLAPCFRRSVFLSSESPCPQISRHSSAAPADPSTRPQLSGCHDLEFATTALPSSEMVQNPCCLKAETPGLLHLPGAVRRRLVSPFPQPTGTVETLFRSGFSWRRTHLGSASDLRARRAFSRV